MNSTIAIIIGALSCTGGTGYLTWRCYCNAQQDPIEQLQQQAQLPTRIITHEPRTELPKQPSPMFDKIIKDFIRKSNEGHDSDTEIDIKIHIQNHNEDGLKKDKE